MATVLCAELFKVERKERREREVGEDYIKSRNRPPVVGSWQWVSSEANLTVEMHPATVNHKLYKPTMTFVNLHKFRFLYFHKTQLRITLVDVPTT